MFGLSKLADKDFVVGYVLPVLVAGAAFIGLFHDCGPVETVVKEVAEGASWSGIAVVALAVWTMATLLMVLNHQILRCLEGYQGPLRREAGKRRLVRELAGLTRDLAALHERTYRSGPPSGPVAAEAPSMDGGHGLASAAEALFALAMLLIEVALASVVVLSGQVFKRNRDGAALDRWRRRIQAPYERRREMLDAAVAGRPDTGGVPAMGPDAYPLALSRRLRAYPAAADVLPTRFGNAVRAFETYPDRVYALDGVTVWTRLAAVVPASYAAIVNEARSEMTMWVNASVLAMLFSLAALARATWSATMAHGGGCLLFLLEAAVAVGAAWIAYGFATERAMAWGETVRAAFDLYLPALAKQLGYALPSHEAGADGRSAFWADISALFLFERAFDPRKWPPASSVEATREDGKGEEGKSEEGESEDQAEEAAAEEEPESGKIATEPPTPVEG